MRNIEVLSLPVSHPPAIQWMMSITLRYGRLLTLACARPSALGCYTRRHEETCQHFVPSTTSWRGAKKKASVRLKELAQGRLEGNELRVPLANDSPQYPAVIQGAKTNMLKYKNCVLLTRVGSFYEVSDSRLSNAT